jgi:UDP-N-acetylmuramyl tripeptide synthase
MILGKGDEDYMEIKGEKVHFDDREVVKLLLEKI